MKKTFFKSILCASLFVGALTSCNEVEDLYNPELARERAQEAFGLPVDPNHTWSMTSVITANITLNEDALSDYSFRVYSEDPLDKNSGATILADYPVKTDAQGKASATFNFEVPTYKKYVYVARVDNHGRRWVGVSEIQNGVINKAFGESSTASTKAADINASTFPEISLPTPYTQEIIDGYLNDASYQVSTLNFDGKSGVIATIIGQNITCNYSNNEFKPSGKCTLVIGQGATLEIPNNGKIEISNIDIIVANGGTLKFSGEMLLKGRLIVLQGGIVDNSNGTSDKNIYVDAPGNASCMIYNDGTIITNSIYLNNGAVIHNDSTGIIKATTKIQFAGGAGKEDIINHGKIQAKEISSNGGGDHGTIYNGCLIRVTEKLSANRISINKNSTIEAPIISTNALYLRENSIARATEKLKPSQSFSLYYIGESGGKALFSTPTWELTQMPSHLDMNNVYVEFTVFSLNGQTKDNSEWIRNQVYPQLFTENSKFGIGEAPFINITDQTDQENAPIETATCAGKGNKPDNYVPEVEPAIFTYAFEDTDKGAGDYDFNDVVIKCSAPINNEIVVTLVAVGAQKRINLMYDNPLTGQIENIFGEVHAAFENGATENFINTIKGNKPFDCPSVKIAVPAGFTYSENGDFFINVVNSSATSHLPNFTDNYEDVGVPYAILVPVDWRYPQEWQRVDSAYANFANWAENALVDMNWYTTEINESKVY